MRESGNHMSTKHKTWETGTDGDLEMESAHKPKNRKCLMCAEPFPSEWAGERICKKCKSSAAWRQG